MNKKYLILEQLLLSGCNFIFILLYARLLGIELFGEYSLIIFTTFLFTMLSHGYIGTLIMTKLNNKNMKFYITYIFIKYISLIIVVFIVITLFKINLLFSISFILLLYYIFLYIVNDLIRKILITMAEYKKLFYYSVSLYFILINGLLYFYISEGLTLDNILHSYIFAYFIMVSLLMFIYKKIVFNRISIKRLKITLKKEKNIIFNLSIFNFLSWLNQRIVFYIQSMLWGTKDIGVVNAYLSILGILNPVLILLENYFLPRMTNMNKLEGKENMLRYFDKIYFRITIFGFLILSAMLINYSSIISFTLGEEYLHNSILFIPLLVTYYFTFLTKKSVILLNIFNQQIVLRALALNIFKFILPFSVLFTVFFGIEAIVSSILIISIFSYLYLKQKVYRIINE